MSSCTHTLNNVTVKLQDEALFAVSVAKQVTVVAPSGNCEPEGGEQSTVGGEQLSLAEGGG
jgi:hypothetical protein